MNSRDTLRFITGFLILSLFAGTSAYLLAGVQSAPKIRGANNSINAQGIATTDIDPRSVASEKPNPAPFIFAKNAEEDSQYTANMTDALANSMAQSLVDNNPEGPQDLGNGQGPAITTPGNISDIINTAVVQQSNNVSGDSWKIEYDLLAKKIQTEKTSEDTITQYTAAMQKITADGYKNPRITELADQGDINSFFILKASAEETVSKLASQKTPDALADYHRKLLEVAVLQKEALTAATDSYSDPLKSAVALQKLGPQIERSLADLEREANGANQKIIGALGNESPALTLLGVKTAHALFPTVDWTHIGVTISNWAKEFWSKIKDKLEAMALSILQDQLVHRLVQQVITWVQGGGKPQFIKNWKGFLSEVGKDAAGTAIDELAPQLCSPFSALIKVQLQQTYLANAPTPRCTIDRVVNNFENFYSNFENGGWVAFGSAAVPSNNFFGASVEASDYVAQKARELKATKNSEAGANGGFLSTERCVEFDTKRFTAPILASSIMVQSFELLKQKPGYDHGECGPDGSDPKIYVCQAYFCTKKETVTPGDVIGSQLNQALGSPIHRIVSAKDITALVSALVNSGLMKLIRAGQRGLTGLIQGGSGETAPSGGGGNNPCTGATTPEELAACTAITSAVQSSTDPGDTQDIANQVKSNVVDVINQLKSGQVSDSSWLALATSTKDRMAQVATACTVSTIPNLASDASVAATTISLMQQVVALESTAISEALQNFQDIKTKIDSAQLSQMSSLANEFSALRDKYNSLLMASPDGRYTNLQDAAKAADDNLAGTTPACATAIPPITTQ